MSRINNNNKNNNNSKKKGQAEGKVMSLPCNNYLRYLKGIIINYNSNKNK